MKINHDYMRMKRCGTRIDKLCYKREAKTTNIFDLLILALFLATFIFVALFLLPKTAHSQTIDDKLAIRAAIGEASGEGYRGLLAVCVGIRNRGTLDGVYGVNAGHVDKQPEWVWDMARKAWKESETNRFHDGSHWESTDFAVPYWAKDMKEVYRYKKHIFYKEK